MSSIRQVFIALLVLSLAALGCSNDPTTPPGGATTGSADVSFGFTVNGVPLTLNMMNYTTPAGTLYSVKTLRFIISNLRLHEDTGGSVLIKSAHYYDLGDATTQTIHVNNLPHANYTSVSFTFGLDDAHNKANAYPSIPAIMNWPPQAGADFGYHYMQLEGNYETDPGTHATAGYTTHTGPAYENGTAYDFSFPVSSSFTPAHIHEGGVGKLDITFDLNGWYMDHTPADGVDTSYDFKTLGDQQIMGNVAAQTKLQTNGPGCFSATLTATGGHDH
ncbi:MAG TPA: MbnP family protein [Candidatus Krumholzibacteria bacterium]|nr:MbnP family protein [Candidatus Krumholzibacteria bacterium]